ncbi:MAG: membrane lipoprotein lipid attachment site-containing protein [Oscillospiraceae bacterium]|nr:membrane lipoprotein lipid attachment site-containing protein [Oscillospiraceae bacterium]
MKKLICVFVVLLVLSGCNIDNSPKPSENSFPEENTALSSETFEPDLKIMHNLIRIVDAVHWTGRTGEPWGVYKGFSDPSEISSEGFMNFFLNVADPSDYFEPKAGKYYFSAEDVEAVLSDYFTDFIFDAKESGWYSPEGEYDFVLAGFCGHDPAKSRRRIDNYFYDEQTNILLIEGSIMDIDDNTIPTGDTFSMEVLIKDGKYFIKSFSFYAGE